MYGIKKNNLTLKELDESLSRSQVPIQLYKELLDAINTQDFSKLNDSVTKSRYLESLSKVGQHIERSVIQNVYSTGKDYMALMDIITKIYSIIDTLVDTRAYISDIGKQNYTTVKNFLISYGFDIYPVLSENTNRDVAKQVYYYLRKKGTPGIIINILSKLGLSHFTLNEYNLNRKDGEWLFIPERIWESEFSKEWKQVDDNIRLKDIDVPTWWLDEIDLNKMANDFEFYFKNKELEEMYNPDVPDQYFESLNIIESKMANRLPYEFAENYLDWYTDTYLNEFGGEFDPTVDGKPINGTDVIWQFKVQNTNPYDLFKVPYEIYVNGKFNHRGTFDILKNNIQIIDFKHPYNKFNNDVITLKIYKYLKDDEKSFVLYCNALSVRIRIHKLIADYFKRYQRNFGIYSIEEWLYKQCLYWNIKMKDAELEDRFRIEDIEIVDDGDVIEDLPDIKTHYRMNDIVLLLDKNIIYDSNGNEKNNHKYKDINSESINNPFYIDKELFYKIVKIRYLVDASIWYVNKNNIDMGVVTIDNYLQPKGNYFNFIKQGKATGINMEFQLSEYEILCLKRIDGRRAIAGNINEPLNSGVFLNEIPKVNILKFKDQYGNILTNANVQIYYPYYIAEEKHFHFNKTIPTIYQTSVYGDLLFKDTMIKSVMTQDKSDDVIDKKYNQFLCKIEFNGKIGFVFLDAWLFNMNALKHPVRHLLYSMFTAEYVIDVYML